MRLPFCLLFGSFRDSISTIFGMSTIASRIALFYIGHSIEFRVYSRVLSSTRVKYLRPIRIIMHLIYYGVRRTSYEGNIYITIRIAAKESNISFFCKVLESFS